MLFNNQGQVAILSLRQQMACRDANTLLRHIDKGGTTISAKANTILKKREEILKPLREKLWPSNEKPDTFFRLGERARLV